MTRFRTDSLNHAPTSQEWLAYLERRKRGDFGPTKARVSGVVVLFVLLAILGPVFGFVVIPVLTSAFAGSYRPSMWSVVFVILLALALIRGIPRTVRSYRRRKRWASLAKFADDNHLRFRIRSADPAYPGCLFSLGDSRASDHHVWSEDGLLADCGTYKWVTGSGKNRSTHSWNFAAFRLPQAMPHILLDARANNVAGMSNLPVTFGAEQRLTLGAPFDEQYALYAPQGYGQDAFYLFPPDLLAMLIDAPADFDIEIVDRWMFLYTQSELDLTRESTWQLLGKIETTIGQRLAEMSGRYRDRRVNPNPPGQGHYGPGQPAAPIAEPGRRLQKGFNPIILVLGGLWIAFLIVKELLQ